nr:MAG TPA: hypothetical protein [Caudoviricetes sp.]
MSSQTNTNTKLTTNPKEVRTISLGFLWLLSVYRGLFCRLEIV